MGTRVIDDTALSIDRTSTSLSEQLNDVEIRLKERITRESDKLESAEKQTQQDIAQLDENIKGMIGTVMTQANDLQRNTADLLRETTDALGQAIKSKIDDVSTVTQDLFERVRTEATNNVNVVLTSVSEARESAENIAEQLVRNNRDIIDAITGKWEPLLERLVTSWVEQFWRGIFSVTIDEHILITFLSQYKRMTEEIIQQTKPANNTE